MDVVTLRTLTQKSILGFGKYKECSVSVLLDLKHSRYLRWVYYNIAGISFTDEILESIYIFEQDKIKKPGTDKEKGESLNNIMFASMNKNDSLNAIKVVNHAKKEMKKDIGRRNWSRSNLYFNKSLLQAKNHGH